MCVYAAGVKNWCTWHKLAKAFECTWVHRATDDIDRVDSSPEGRGRKTLVEKCTVEQGREHTLTSSMLFMCIHM